MSLVLVIEDEPDSAELMAQILRMEGFEVSRARTGDEGIRKANHEDVDVILLDVMLPGMDGFEVCRRLRENPRTAGIPIGFISAKTREEDRQDGMDAGGNVYLAKPISRAALVSAARWLLDVGSAQPPEPRASNIPSQG